MATATDFRTISSMENGFGWSNDGGQTWNLFGSIIANALVNFPNSLMAGCVAVSCFTGSQTPANANIVWWPANRITPAGATETNRPPAPFYRKNGGASWTQTTALGSPTDANGNPFYDGLRHMGALGGLFNRSVRAEYVCADGVMVGKFYLYVPFGSPANGYVSTDGGDTWTAMAGQSALRDYCFGGQLPSLHGCANHR